jgi:cyclopropane fatty-acyl-phospholipid synthase-like methyltransferase
LLATAILTAGLDIGSAVYDTVSGIGEFARLYGSERDRSVVGCDLDQERCRFVVRRLPDQRFVDRLLGAIRLGDRQDADAERCPTCGRAP